MASLPSLIVSPEETPGATALYPNASSQFQMITIPSTQSMLKAKNNLKVSAYFQNEPKLQATNHSSIDDLSRKVSSISNVKSLLDMNYEQTVTNKLGRRNNRNIWYGQTSNKNKSQIKHNSVHQSLNHAGFNALRGSTKLGLLPEQDSLEADLKSEGFSKVSTSKMSTLGNRLFSLDRFGHSNGSAVQLPGIASNTKSVHSMKGTSSVSHKMKLQKKHVIKNFNL